METDLEEIEEADSPTDEDFEFQKTLYFPTTRRCRLSQTDMKDFDPLRSSADRESDVQKTGVEADLSSSVTLEDMKTTNRNSILSQTDSGFDGKSLAI